MSFPSKPTLEPVTPLLGNKLSVPYKIGSGTIQSLKLRINKSVGDSTILTYDLTNSSSPYTTAALENGVKYTLKLQQINTDGTVLNSNAVTGTPTDVPLKPVIGTVASGDHAIAFTVNTGVLQGGALTGLTFPLFFDSTDTNQVTSQATSQSSWSFADGGSSTDETECNVVPTPNVPNSYNVTILGLENGTLYELQAQSINPVGASPDSNEVTGTPQDVPNELERLSVTPGDASALLLFSPAPVPHYDSITSVSIKLTTGSSTQTLTVPANEIAVRAPGGKYEYTLANLTNGASYVAEVAVNLQNGGLANYVSSPSFIPFKKPNPPRSVTAFASDEEVTLTWLAPLSNGGASIDHYNIYMNDYSVAIDSTTDLEYHVLNLQNGFIYSFTVTAVTVDPNVSPVVNIGENESWKSSPEVSSKPFTESDPPTGLEAEAGDMFVTLRWEAPRNTGGLPIDHYDVFNVSSGTPNLIGASPSTSLIVSSLTNGNEYTFAVTAVTLSSNDGSNVPSSLSDSVHVTPTAPPPAVSGFNVIAVASRTVSVMSITWTALTSSVYVEASAISGYKITWGSESKLVYGQLSNSTSIPMSQFTLGSSYSFNIQAIMTDPNDGSDVFGSLTTAVSQTAFTTPGAPKSVLVDPGDGTLAVSWDSPDSVGGTIGYLVSISKPDSNYEWLQIFAADISVTNYTFTGLVNGVKYLIMIQSSVGNPNDGVSKVNGEGFNESGYYAYRRPGAPTGLSATAGDQSVELTWSSPSSNGGFPIAYYNVYVDDVLSYNTVADETNFTVSDLENGTSYSFNVTAVILNLNKVSDQAEEGPASGSVAAIPLASIGPVQNVTVTPGNLKLTLNYSAPSTQGTGMSIVKYMVQLDSLAPVSNGLNLSYVFVSPAFTMNNDTAYKVTVYAVTANPNDSSDVNGDFYSIENCIPSGDPIMLTLALNPAKNVITATMKGNGNTIDECFCIATDGTNDYVVQIKDLLPAFPDNIPTSPLNAITTLTIPMTNANPAFPPGAKITGAYVFASNGYGMSMIQL